MGGYGRRELAPYSDIDVMVLTRGNQAEVARTISKGVFHRLWDLGFQVGHSVRSIAECLAIAETDLPACTSLMESRFLGGNAAVFQELQKKFCRRILKKQSKRFILDKIEERRVSLTHPSSFQAQLAANTSDFRVGKMSDHRPDRVAVQHGVRIRKSDDLTPRAVYQTVHHGRLAVSVGVVKDLSVPDAY